MLAYVFLHAPYVDIDVSEYENAPLGFHEDLMADPPAGLETSATYQISEVPTSSAALDTLNNAAVRPERSNMHAAVSCKTDLGHGGRYYHLHGADKPIAGSRVTWLKRPRGIRYEQLCAKLSVSRHAS